MGDFVTADHSEVRAFAQQLERAAADALPEIRAVVQRGALAIKTQMQREMSESRHFRQVGRAVSYDTTMDAGGVEAEIGPRRGRPGSLANIAYFGTSRGGGTVADPQGALDAEAPNVERHILDVLGKALS